MPDFCCYCFRIARFKVLARRPWWLPRASSPRFIWTCADHIRRVRWWHGG